MIPQSVTSRYISNLIDRGANESFRLDSITCHRFCVEEEHCGFFFKAGVIQGDSVLHSGVGASPIAAVKTALAKAGVTFR